MCPERRSLFESARHCRTRTLTAGITRAARICRAPAGHINVRKADIENPPYDWRRTPLKS